MRKTAKRFSISSIYFSRLFFGILQVKRIKKKKKPTKTKIFKRKTTFSDCEHLIRHMLVVEPERRLSLSQILQHRWMSSQSSIIEETKQTIITEPTTLDTVVITNMLQLPNLTFDEIAESVHQSSFNHIYAIYSLLVDKLHTKRKEQQRLQHHTSLAYSK